MTKHEKEAAKLALVVAGLVSLAWWLSGIMWNAWSLVR